MVEREVAELETEEQAAVLTIQVIGDTHAVEKHVWVHCKFSIICMHAQNRLFILASECNSSLATVTKQTHKRTRT